MFGGFARGAMDSFFRFTFFAPGLPAPLGDCALAAGDKILLPSPFFKKFLGEIFVRPPGEVEFEKAPESIGFVLSLWRPGEILGC